MYIITDKGGTILGIGSVLDYMPNGYPLLKESNSAFVKDLVEVHEVEKTPEAVEPYKYCYGEIDGFFKNPNWVEPDATNTYGIPDDIYHTIQEDLLVSLAEDGLL